MSRPVRNIEIYLPLDYNDGRPIEESKYLRVQTELLTQLRIRGSHHIFTKAGVDEILNLQPKGHHAKPYQVKQVRAVIVKYRLAGE